MTETTPWAAMMERNTREMIQDPEAYRRRIRKEAEEYARRTEFSSTFPHFAAWVRGTRTQLARKMRRR